MLHGGGGAGDAFKEGMAHTHYAFFGSRVFARGQYVYVKVEGRGGSVYRFLESCCAFFEDEGVGVFSGGERGDVDGEAASDEDFG